MVEEKNTKVEKETKKLDDVKNTPENKEAIAKAEGKTVETKIEEAKVEEVKTEKVKTEKVASKPAVSKTSKKESKVEGSIELERIYTVPLRKGTQKVPQYRRAKKAVKVLKLFLVKHMGVRDRDTRKIKVDINLNNEIWFRGIKKPANKIKVNARKIDGIVYATLADAPDVVKFKVARMEKRKAAANVKAPRQFKKKEESKDKDKDGVKDVVAEKEDGKSEAVKDAKVAKESAKTARHTTEGAHSDKKAPVANKPSKQ